MKGARINFGVPKSEYVLLANDNGEATSLKNQDTGTEYIGGGSSDFSTATLRLINGTGITLGLNVAYTDSFDEYNFSSALINTVLSDDVSYNVILYKGEAVAVFNDSSIDPVISGDIVYEDGAYVITGDCTITIS